ncbi:hypothetical protein [Microcoleus sp. CAWBG58]|uniref:hypothetical protein n=1 Tax=Microcoleus sp. CAWBG58 TaxID=2841651 RepID=UPI0025F367AA|nr:hypothetical protein [Microcoleus sp. CAWBG58]
MVESPPAFEGEIKIRLFITPILGLIGRGRSQTDNCQLSTVERVPPQILPQTDRPYCLSLGKTK